jgi:hypothetical protein
MQRLIILRSRGPRAPRRVGLIDLAQGLQHIPAFLGEVRGNVYNLPSSMSHTVSQQDFHTRQLRRVPRESVAHLNGCVQFRRALFQDISEILARMLPAGKVQRDAPEGKEHQFSSQQRAALRRYADIYERCTSTAVQGVHLISPLAGLADRAPSHE